ncbi:unnamed protein product [Nesidiocoris tenuis]|uniref:Uncharacterized protein n=1 Tax=Nesidiocoris tenuis TaxID=355587 RepID=A0A6H5HLP1_9HEMI|nr:unnamed protein product [Nesidiocoris tenuis]
MSSRIGRLRFVRSGPGQAPYPIPHAQFVAPGDPGAFPVPVASIDKIARTRRSVGWRVSHVPAECRVCASLTAEAARGGHRVPDATCWMVEGTMEENIRHL